MRQGLTPAAADPTISTAWRAVPAAEGCRRTSASLSRAAAASGNRCYLAPDAIVSQAIPAGLYHLPHPRFASTRRRPRCPASALLRRSARPNVGRVGREPLLEAHAVTEPGQAGQAHRRPGPERQERGQKRQPPHAGHPGRPSPGRLTARTPRTPTGRSCVRKRRRRGSLAADRDAFGLVSDLHRR